MPGFENLLDTLERWRRLPGLERADGARGAVLTFDDGPDEDSTPSVLAALEELGAAATFFLVGEQVERFPELAREIPQRGHEVALHGYRHVAHPLLSPEAAHEDLAHGTAVLRDVIGAEPRFYRPPYGRFSDGSYRACRELGLEPVYWSSWGTDWETISPERIAELATEDLGPGAILLLHDSPRYAHRPTAAPTAAALPLIGDWAAHRGLELTSLGRSIRRG
jgi:peptidoglycan/xylan/chitin deacetylase (PgdA/CDA1 family)